MAVSDRRWIATRGRWLVLAGIVSIVTVIAICVRVAVWPPNARTWGTVADWVVGTGTVAALLVAALAYRHQLENRRQEYEDDLKSQIRLVHAWTFDAAIRRDEHLFAPFSGNCGVRVTNESDLPVYEVSLGFVTHGGITLRFQPI